MSEQNIIYLPGPSKNTPYNLQQHPCCIDFEMSWTQSCNYSFACHGSAASELVKYPLSDHILSLLQHSHFLYLIFCTLMRLKGPSTCPCIHYPLNLKSCRTSITNAHLLSAVLLHFHLHEDTVVLKPWAVSTVKCSKSVSVFFFFLFLWILLSLIWEAFHSAAHCWKMHGEPLFIRNNV